ncbi:MAG: 50S ribosomal protein L20 [Candidatus Omnitrophica bacterium]|nr:50S ribosomal protein L20 [Candidatus Omnitrophota bacterium]MCM8800099.1 50S ribosomal protein L20 [Candidatus Omnitrophota bacterium]
MVKVKLAVKRHRRKKKLLKQAEGFWGDRSKQYQQARRTLARAYVFSYRDRKAKKRAFRKLWIARINAACRAKGISYNRFIAGLKKANVSLNRKMLADLALNDEQTFNKLVELAKS